ncbi:MAG: hypothetical protein JBO36_15475 [Candidatus Thiodiazotropha taylori]|nr:hypothetical protein [Candidatus Thiodiazotropha taylori]
MLFKNYLFLVLPLLLQACASNPAISSLTSEQRSNLLNIEIHNEGVTQEYTNLGQVKGLSCHRNAHMTQQLGSDEAIQGLKIRAVQLGADAVINMVCQKNSGTDWVNNCWASIICVGDAIKLIK